MARQFARLVTLPEGSRPLPGGLVGGIRMDPQERAYVEAMGRRPPEPRDDPQWRYRGKRKDGPTAEELCVATDRKGADSLGSSRSAETLSVDATERNDTMSKTRTPAKPDPKPGAQKRGSKRTEAVSRPPNKSMDSNVANDAAAARAGEAPPVERIADAGELQKALIDRVKAEVKGVQITEKAAYVRLNVGETGRALAYVNPGKRGLRVDVTGATASPSSPLKIKVANESEVEAAVAKIVAAVPSES